MNTQRLLGGVLLLVLVACGGTSGGLEPTALHPVVVNGAYAWHQVDPPRADFVHGLQLTTDGQLWIAGRELRHFDGAAFATVAAPPDAAPSDYAGSVWARSSTEVLTAGTRLLRWDGASWFNEGAKLPSMGPQTGLAVTHRIARASTGLWVYRGVTGGGLNPMLLGRLTGDTFESFPFSTGNPQAPVAGLVELADGRLAAPGVGVMTGRTWQVGLHLEPTLTSNLAWALSADERFLSWARNSGGEWSFVAAVPPADFTAVATLPASAFALPAFPRAAPGEIVDVAATADGALFVHVSDVPGQLPVTQLAVLEGTSARVLPDRLEGVRAVRLAVKGTKVFIVDTNGAVFQGERQ